MDGVRPGDYLFFHYSGHGGQQTDKDGDESDGKDETLVPLDYQTAGQITDDELHKLLVARLPHGAHMTVVCDCCHSGTILDLPYVYRTTADGSVKMDYMKKAKQIMADATILGTKNVDMTQKVEAGKRMFSNFMSMLSAPSESDGTKDAPTGLVQESNKTGAEVYLITGCKDEQTSADAMINNCASGALTFGLLYVLNAREGQLSYEELLVETRACLEGKYTQVPQLCVGIEMDLKKRFEI